MDQQFHIPLSDPTLKYTIIFTTKTDVEDHEPLRTQDAFEGAIRAGLEQDTRYYTLPDALVERFMATGRFAWLSPGKNGKKHLPKEPHIELYCRFAFKHDNKSIDVGLEIIAPESVPYNRTSCPSTTSFLQIN